VSESTTFWLRELQAGNREAAQELWQRYYHRLVAAARKRLAGGRLARSAIDESDIAQSAFARFYQAAEQGRFPQLNDRNDLWRLLLMITERRIASRLRQQNCAKRMHQQSERSYSAGPINVADIAGDEPSPEFCAAAVESIHVLLNQLNDSTLRDLAVMKMEGYTNQEIALRLDCSLSTVERKLRRIRHGWTSAAVTAEDHGDA
jgi:RNA polymerase sigma factor (sigma-70 family)